MGFFSKLKAGLSKTRANIVSGFNSVFTGRSAIDDDFYDDLEEIMIMGDMGVRATDEILDDLREKVKKNKIKEPAECSSYLLILSEKRWISVKMSIDLKMKSL